VCGLKTTLEVEIKVAIVEWFLHRTNKLTKFHHNRRRSYLNWPGISHLEFLKDWCWGHFCFLYNIDEATSTSLSDCSKMTLYADDMLLNEW